MIVLLGPQTKGESDVGRVLRELDVKKRVALVMSGWQEREGDEKALVDELATVGVKTVNLRLHARSEEVFKADTELATAHKARQEVLRHLQEFYRMRLDYNDAVTRAISVRHVDSDLLEQEFKMSVEQFRQLDRSHIERCQAIHEAFEENWRPRERDAVAKHFKELRDLLEPVEAVVIAGGHVASLLNRIRLFGLVGLAAGKHLVAWSAGAMVLTERVVLFHDYPPYGTAIAQVLDAGIGLAPGLVVLPDPKRRIRVDDRGGITRFAQRMAPATCLAMDRGASVFLDGDRITRANAERLTLAGDLDATWAGEGT